MRPFSPAHYLGLLQTLIPTGQAWTREFGTWLTSLLEGIAQELARVDAGAHLVIDETDPQTTVLLMPEWEELAGLPNECSQAGATLAERRAQLLFTLAATGGQSPEYFKDLAYIYTMMVCTVTEYQPFVASSSAAGDALTNDDWRFAWKITAPDMVMREFAAGQSTAGEPLRAWGNETLECIIGKLKPAHTHVNFTYEEA